MSFTIRRNMEEDFRKWRWEEEGRRREEKEAEELWEIIYQSLHRHAQSGWNEHVGYERFRAVKKKEKFLSQIS